MAEKARKMAREAEARAKPHSNYTNINYVAGVDLATSPDSTVVAVHETTNGNRDTMTVGGKKYGSK